MDDLGEGGDKKPKYRLVTTFVISLVSIAIYSVNIVSSFTKDPNEKWMWDETERLIANCCAWPSWVVVILSLVYMDTE